MAYIDPLSTILLCRVDGLDPTYQNTMYFPDLNSQLDYFENKQIQLWADEQLTKQNYIRVKPTAQNRVKVGLPIGRVTRANYIIIKNDGENSENNSPVVYEKNYIFAFITQYNYISENVTEITFEIDVIQTYLFDYTETECFVEREHTATDNIGEYVASEPVDPGPMKAVEIEESSVFDKYMIVVATAYTGS